MLFKINSTKIIVSSNSVRRDLKKISLRGYKKSVVIKHVNYVIPKKNIKSINYLKKKYNIERKFYLVPNHYWVNKNNTVLATSGNNKFKFDIKQQGFAWMTSNKKEKIMVKVMKKGSRIMLTGYNEKGSQTIDHYSLLGFTKAYNKAKDRCKS